MAIEYPAYEPEEGWTVQRYDVPGGTLRFQAQSVRRERTGIHAKVGISLNWQMLAWSQFNVERDEDRVRLANSAVKAIEDADHELLFKRFPKAAWKHALDQFCLGLWDDHVGQIMGGPMAGDPEAEPARLLLGQYCLEEGGTILMAPPGEGKTYTALAMAVSLAYGLDHIWEVRDHAVPLYINMERGAKSMQARLAAVNRCLGIPADSPLPFLNARGMSLNDVYEAAQRTINREGVTYVFYDSISRAGKGSMVGDDVANSIMDMLNALSPGWLAIGHSPRNDDGHVYGSVMFDAAADLVIQLKSQRTSDGSQTGIGMEGTKANDLPMPRLAIHVAEWHGQYPYTYLGALRKAKPGEFAQLEAGESMSVEDRLVQLLLGQPNLSTTDILKQVGADRSHVSSILNKSPRFIHRQQGRERLWAVKMQENLPVPPEQTPLYHD